MGNTMTVEERARFLEKKILVETGLELDKDLHISDIKIDYLGTNYIHTLECGDDENKNVMVMLHGYGGSGVFFFKMLKDLSLSYKVYCIDLLGMGLSSRPEFNCESTEDTINYFIDSIEQWRLSVGLDKIIICGHSLGGYIAGQYASKYSDSVIQMILFSPLGVTKGKTEYNLDSEEYEKLGFFRKRLYNIRVGFFRDKKSVSELANKYAWLFAFFIRRNMTKRFRVETDIGQTIYEFCFELYKLPIGSEKAIHYIIGPSILAFHPLEEIIGNMKIPVTVFFGQQDWMNDTGAKNLDNQNLKNYRLIYIDDCGHQMTMENPNELLKHLIIKKNQDFSLLEE